MDLTISGEMETEMAMEKNDVMVKEEAVMNLHGTEMMTGK